MTERAEIAVECHAPHGEGSMWDGRDNVLIWVSIEQDTVYRWDPRTGRVSTFDVGQPVGAIVPRSAGGYALAVEHGFAAVDALGETPRTVATIEQSGPRYRMNDAKCDPRGRFWAGTMAYDETPGVSALYRLENGTVRTILTGVTISNGLGWSPDNGLMYYIDTPTGRVDVFDYDLATGDITNRRPLVHVSPDVGHPDGMTVDAEGYLWVCLWGGGAVHRYSPKGELDRTVQVPSTFTTDCVFGGPDLTDLYITSAAHASGGKNDDQPHAGDVFVFRPGVAGLPTNAFAG